jgi:hypothetical protein
MSKSVWALIDEEIMEHISLLEEDDARQWLAGLMATLNHEAHMKVFVTLWAIWNARRRAIHEQVYQSPLSVHFFVQQFVADLEHSRD